MSNTNIDKVWKAQIGALRNLESSIISLEKATKELKTKVQNQKLEPFYSTNSDCLTYATAVWRSCLRLCELKKLEWELTGKDSNGRLIQKKDTTQDSNESKGRKKKNGKQSRNKRNKQV